MTTASDATSEKRVGAVLFYAVLAVLGYYVYLIFEPFLAPLAWAGILVVFFFSLFIGLGWSVLYLLLEAQPLVFGDVYGFNTGEVGLTFWSMA